MDNVITQEEYRVFTDHIVEAERLADSLSSGQNPAAAAGVMALRQSLRAVLTRAIEAGAAIKATDEILTIFATEGDR